MAKTKGRKNKIREPLPVTDADLDALAAELPPKQVAFATEYCVDANATQAAIRAGYPARSAYIVGHEIMEKPVVKALIAKLKAKQMNRIMLTADRVLVEVARIAFSDPRKYYNEDGSLKEITELDDDAAAALASFEVTENLDGTSQIKKIRNWSKTEALKNLLMHFRLLPNAGMDINVSGRIDHAHGHFELKEILDRLPIETVRQVRDAMRLAAQPPETVDAATGDAAVERTGTQEEQSR